MNYSERARRRAAVLKDLHAGKFAQETADKFGLTAKYVENIGRAAGLSLPTAIRCVATLKILAELLTNKASQAQIAKNRGISRQRVNEVYRAAILAGVPGL